ncbi:MAG: (Fe-S)-binding protein [Chloroflexi bacterium]|nr:(Fe-S)-binding protein [Chloroflexota bacterium]
MINGIELLQSQDYKSKLTQCIHCGMCLQACPTYAVFGTEMDAPRGRIALMRAASEGRINLQEFTNSFTTHINLCLACRACETACPSGVKYGILVDGAQTAIVMNRQIGVIERFVRWFGLRQMMPNLGLLKLMARAMWLYEITGVQKIVRALAPRILPKPLKAMEAILPPIEPQYRDYRAPAPALGEKRGEVAFFIGCIQEAFLAQVNEATIRVLQRNGYQVHFPPGQTCCGAAQIHQGEHALARDLARQNIDAFLARDYVAVISNAGGCGATLKDELVHLFHDDPVYFEKAKQFAAKVKDISEFLTANLRVPPTGEVQARVTYSDSCHLRHVQKVVKPPRELLKRIPGIELVELKLPDRCCGSAGVYNIVQADSADAILDAKMQDIAETGADWIIASNIGCHMQLIAGARKANLEMPVYHVVQVLDMSYQAMEKKA